MGGCFSRGGGTHLVAAADHHKNNPNIYCANVVSLSGDLRLYPLPITVSQVLDSETTTTTATTSSPFFLCDSDCLYFDQYIPPLAPLHQLQPAQLYFVLPLPKLHSTLSASEMAALAVKASLAIQTHAHHDNNNINIPRTSRHPHPARISPVLLVQEQEEHHPTNLNINNYNGSRQRHEPQSPISSSSFAVSTSTRGSAFSPRNKLQRLSSRRSKTALRSFGIRLTTISEGSVLLFN